METIAVFDFDGTLTKKDSFKDFLVYTFGIAKFYHGILKNIFQLTSYACGLITNQQAKERMFKTFFAGWTGECFQRICITYSLEKIDGILRSEAKDRMEWHKAQAHRVVMVSASLVDWLTPWAIKNGFHDVIATEPEIKNGVLTGRFSTPNCHGQEKKRRFLEKYPDRNRYILYVYGDSNGDKELLKMADKPFFRCFR